MNVTIQSPKTKADIKLIQFIEETIKKLTKFNEQITSAAVYLQLPSGSQTIKDKVVKVQINIAGVTVFAERTAKTFEKSFMEAYASIKNQIVNKQKRQRRRYWQAA